MSDNLLLRPVKMTDAEDLLRWRNDISTRQASHNMDVVSLASHLAWLESSLNKPIQRRLWIAEIAGVSVGSCRADYSDNEWELSWTIAPESRNKGIARQMLVVLLEIFNEPLSAKTSLLAQIKSDNIASMKVAESVGFVLDKEEKGVLFYRFS